MEQYLNDAVYMSIERIKWEDIDEEFSNIYLLLTPRIFKPYNDSIIVKKELSYTLSRELIQPDNLVFMFIMNTNFVDLTLDEGVVISRLMMDITKISKKIYRKIKENNIKSARKL